MLWVYFRKYRCHPLSAEEEHPYQFLQEQQNLLSAPTTFLNVQALHRPKLAIEMPFPYRRY